MEPWPEDGRKKYARGGGEGGRERGQGWHIQVRGGEGVQGRQRNRKKGINQHRFHYGKVRQAVSVYQRKTGPRTVSPQRGHHPHLTLPTHNLPSFLQAQATRPQVPERSGVGPGLGPFRFLQAGASNVGASTSAGQRETEGDVGLCHFPGDPPPARWEELGVGLSRLPPPLFLRFRILESHFQMETLGSSESPSSPEPPKSGPRNVIQGPESQEVS